MSFHSLQIQDLSATQFDALIARLGHYDGLSLTPDGNGVKVAGDGLSGRLVHDPAANILGVELQQIPATLTPGNVVGRLYDEIHCSHCA
jgi:hypothetical protein